MFDITKFDVRRYDSILARGLSPGLGENDGQMCIEAAICATLGLPHGDDPGCVAVAVRTYKISLNDSPWSTPAARADALHDLGLAQLGSKGIVDDLKFTRRLSELTIRILLPRLFRETLHTYPDCLNAADRCEKEGTRAAARAATEAARVARAAGTAEAATAAAEAAQAAEAAARAAARMAARVAEEAAEAATFAATGAAEAAMWAARAEAAAETAAGTASDSYLRLSASLALQVLHEMDSPGCVLLT